jgi:hypothetical protein
MYRTPEGRSVLRVRVICCQGKPNDYVHPAVTKIHGVRATLRSEPDHRARFSLQPTKVSVFIGVNACGQI